MLLYENKYFVEKIDIRKNMLKDLTVSLSEKMIIYQHLKQQKKMIVYLQLKQQKKWLFFDILSNRVIVYGYIKQKNDCLSTP